MKREPFFTPGPASSMYERNRDAEHRAGLRERIERWWETFAPYCGDEHFLSDARQHFVQRTWELYLGALLLEAGFQLERPPSDGPDFKVVTGDGPLWIEAVAPTSGTGADEAKRLINWQNETGTQATYRLDHDKRVLRYTSALLAKNEQYTAFKERGVVGARDRFVIAINGGGIDDADLGFGFPDIVRALYPIDQPVFCLPLDPSQSPWTSVSHRTEIFKAAGAPVSTEAFLQESYAGVSMVLFSPDAVWNLHDLIGREVITVHNARARCPVRRGTVPLGKEYWVDDRDHLQTIDHRQAAPEATDDE